MITATLLFLFNLIRIVISITIRIARLAIKIAIKAARIAIKIAMRVARIAIKLAIKAARLAIKAAKFAARLAIKAVKFIARSIKRLASRIAKKFVKRSVKKKRASIFDKISNIKGKIGDAFSNFEGTDMELDDSDDATMDKLSGDDSDNESSPIKSILMIAPVIMLLLSKLFSSPGESSDESSNGSTPKSKPKLNANSKRDLESVESDKLKNPVDNTRVSNKSVRQAHEASSASTQIDNSVQGNIAKFGTSLYGTTTQGVTVYNVRDSAEITYSRTRSGLVKGSGSKINNVMNIRGDAKNGVKVYRSKDEDIGYFKVYDDVTDNIEEFSGLIKKYNVKKQDFINIKNKKEAGKSLKKWEQNVYDARKGFMDSTKSYITVKEFIYIYAPPADKNNTSNYVKTVCLEAGVTEGTDVKQVSSNKKLFIALVKAIARHENQVTLSEDYLGKVWEYIYNKGPKPVTHNVESSVVLSCEPITPPSKPLSNTETTLDSTPEATVTTETKKVSIDLTHYSVNG